MFAYDVHRYSRLASPTLTARRLYTARFKGIYTVKRRNRIRYRPSGRYIRTTDTSRIFFDRDVEQCSFIVHGYSFAVLNLSDRASLDFMAARTHIIAAADGSHIRRRSAGLANLRGRSTSSVEHSIKRTLRLSRTPQPPAATHRESPVRINPITLAPTPRDKRIDFARPRDGSVYEVNRSSGLGPYISTFARECLCMFVLVRLFVSVCLCGS